MASMIVTPSDDESGKAEQWSSITSFLRSAGVAERSFSDFSDSVEIDWATNRFNEPLSLYLDSDWESVLGRRGFGSKKLEQLFRNMRAIAKHLGWSSAAYNASRSVERPPDPSTVITEVLRLPSDFPISAGFFSERVVDFCAKANLRTITDLMRFTDDSGWRTAALAFRNFGKSSLAEIEEFSNAIRQVTQNQLQNYLPIRSNGGGVDLGLVALTVAREHSSIGLDGLTKRLVHGVTLEEIAAEKQLTRERVRQIEFILLGSVERVLNAVASVRTELWTAWSENGELFSVGTEHGNDADRLAAAAVERMFGESEEGRGLHNAREAACQAAYEALCEEPGFYSGEIVLSTFLDARSNDVALRHLLRWNRQTNAFLYHEESGRAEVIHPRPKHIVAALLKRGIVNVSAVLDFLRKIKDPVTWDITNLRRNYQNWRQDSDFPVVEMAFPVPIASQGLKSRPTSKPIRQGRDEPAAYNHIRNALRRQRDRLSGGQESIPFQDRLQISLPGADVEQLKVLDQTLRGVLAATGDSQPLLGLLPVAHEFQLRSIGCVKSAVARNFNRLLTCLHELPCLTGYVLAIGPGSKMDGLAFFEPLEQYLDISIPNPKRIDLSEAFRKVGQQLGLLPIPLKDRTDNVWPFVFQAAIIPRFVEPLIEAMLRELKESIPPDLENSDGLASFARGIASHINPSQQRLRTILQSDAGASVSRVLLRGYQTGDFTQMPPHLEQRCAEAFRDVQPQQRYSLVSPYVAYDSNAGEMSLVLPRQSPRLLLPDTIWTLGDGHRFPADTETRLPVSDFEQTPLIPVLAPLHHGTTRRWEPKLDIRLSIDAPVWLFDSTNGRRVQLKADHVEGIDVLRLPSGRDFAIVTLREVSSDLPEEHWTLLSGNLKTVRYESFWGQTSVMLSFGDRKWRITCREEPCILFETEIGGRLRTVDGEEAIFGKWLKITLVSPPEEETSEEVSTLRFVSDPEKMHTGSETELKMIFEQHVAELPNGLHFLDLEFRVGGKTARRKAWFWKGLEYIDSSFGFRCVSVPTNIRWGDCEGIAKDDSGVRVLSRWSAPEITIATVSPAARLRLRRPGVAVAILDVSTGLEEPCDLGTNLSVSPNDSRRLLVRLEASGKWRIETNGAVLARTDNGAIKGIFRLGDLVGSQSGSARVTAIHGEIAPLTLLRLHRQVAVTGLEVIPDGIENRYYIRFCVPQSIKGIAVSRTVFPRINDAAKTVTEIPLFAGKTVSLGDLAGAAALVKEALGGGLLVEMFVPYSCLKDDWHIFELLHRGTAGDEWSMLHVAEGSGVYGSRWVLSPAPSAVNESTDFARNVLRLARNRSDMDAPRQDAPAIPDDLGAIHDAFEAIEFLLDYRYAHAAWDAAKWARAGFIWLAKHVQETKPAVLAQRAVRGLAQRPNNSETFRPIHFGSSELACAFPGVHFRMPAYPAGVIGDCFSMIGRRVGSQSSVSLLASAGSDISCQPFTHFGNFSLAAQGKANRFQNLKLTDLLADLAKCIDQYSIHANDADEGALLSSRHWAEAHAAFERRFRKLRVDETGGAGPRNTIARIEPYLRNIEFPLKQALHVSSSTDLEWLSLPGDALSRTVLRQVFWTAALGRMSAYGWISPNDYRATIMRVFNDGAGDPNVVRKGLSLCIGLCPEWFSASMLLWELIISDLPNPNLKNAR